jgi:hypothetical protein
MKTGNLIASSIIALWGAAILVSAAVRDDPNGGGAYGAGQNAALVFAVAMVAVGGLGIRKELRRRAG